MIIYDSEKSIASLLEEKKSVAYIVQVQEGSVNTDIIDKALALGEKTCGTNLNQEDLFYIKTIMVTTGMNLNMDVFLADHTWAARTSPEDKPLNLNHDEKHIVGHITSNCVVDFSGNVIANDSETYPQDFHIVTSAVVYKKWSDKDLQSRMNEVIASIKDGKKFVSMEAYFNDFDYFLVADNSSQVVARNNDTAYLTKYLSCYGGNGVYNGRRVGRVLKNITFSGKGLVDNPANPQSIILSHDDRSVANRENVNMSEYTKADFDSLNKELRDQEAARIKAEAKVDQLEEAVAHRDSVIKSNEETLARKQEEIEAAMDEGKKKDKMYKDQEADMKSKSEALETAEAKIKELEEKIAKAEADGRLVARIGVLVEAGLEKEVATKKAEALAEISDAAFEAFVDLAKASIPTEKKEEDKSLAGVLDDSEKSQAAVQTESNDLKYDLDKVRASITSRLVKSKE